MYVYILVHVLVNAYLFVASLNAFALLTKGVLFWGGDMVVVVILMVLVCRSCLKFIRRG